MQNLLGILKKEIFSANPTLHHIKTRKMYRDSFFIAMTICDNICLANKIRTH